MPLRVIFMGTPDFCLPTLNLLHSEHNLVGVFCQPDKINGRNNQVSYCATKQFAIEHDISVFQPLSFKNFACLDILKELNPDVIVVAAYGKILPNYVLEYPKFGCINIHGSLLPVYRGASPIQHAILNGDDETGVTIIKMNEKMDEGDILHQSKLFIGEYETSEELFVRMSILGAKATQFVLDMFAENKAITPIPQDHSKATYTKKIEKEHGLLDFNSMSAHHIKNLVYGLNSWPSAYFIANGVSYKVHKVKLGRYMPNLPAGTVCQVDKNGIEVVCHGGYTVIISEMQQPNKKKMDAYAFACGHIIPIGNNIHTI